MREPPHFRRQSESPMGLELITSLHPQRQQHSWASQFAGCINIIAPSPLRKSSLAECCDLMKKGCADGLPIVMVENSQGWTGITIPRYSIRELWLLGSPVV